MRATVTPTFVDPPKPGKTNLSVKGDDGTRFSVPPKFGPSFVVGLPVTVDYEEKFYQGKTFNMVEGVMPVSMRAQFPAPVAKDLPVEMSHGPQTQVKPSTDHKDMLIFVTGVVGRAMGSGQFSTTDVKILTLAALEAYKEIK